MRIILLFALVVPSLSAAPPRVRYTINEHWRYEAGALEAMVNLPHTWNVADAFDKEPGYRRGIGWYRKALKLDPTLRGKRLFLYFEGANQVADVYVNDYHAGRHVGGYTAFVFEVTDLVRWEGSNLVAVRVDNSHSEEIPPLNADFTFYGGIYRDVWLVATEPIHITLTDYASSGVFVTPASCRPYRRHPGGEVAGETPAERPPGRPRYEVCISGTVVNQSDVAQHTRVVNRIFDADGKEVTTTSSEMTIAAGGSERFLHETKGIADPRLWSPDDPYLYLVRSEVYAGSRLVDAVENPLGFRSFRFDGQNGFFLNGKPLKLIGTNRHQDYSGLGNALPDEIHRRDMRIIRENGFNFVRLAHYPQDPAVLEATDRLGLVVWEEIPVVNLISLSPAFAQNAERMLTEMIRQHYNHPSVLIWGYMNEVLLTKPSPIPPSYYAGVVELTRRLEARVHAEDPSRATVMALSRDEVNADYGIGDIPDILGMNLYFGWYYDEIDALGPFLDDLHRRRPQRPLIISEYGADSDERVHARNPVAFDFSSEYQQLFHRRSFPQIEARRYLLGSAVWNQFDFGSELRHDTKHALNQKGLYFFDRTPKDIAFYYKAALRKEPVVYIAREWNRRAGQRMQPLWVYSNLQNVELFVNGRSAGSRPVRNRTAEWNVELAEGTNRIEVSGADAVAMTYSGIVSAINAGADYSYTDAAGVVWETDRGYVGGEKKGTHHRIFSTMDDALFQASREGMDAYRFDVPDGSYEVTLGFGEWTTEQRVFSVKVNGIVVFADLDLAADFGVFTAATRTIRVEVHDGEGIRIDFKPKIGKPAIAAIQIRRL